VNEQGRLRTLQRTALPPPGEATIAIEIELKLTARARDLPLLARTLEARAGHTRDGARARLVSTYFDTPDRALARRGLALRVREDGGHFVQTVIGNMSQSGLAREEWEDPIDGVAPDPQARRSGRLLPADAVGRLVPLFRTEVARHTIMLSPAPGTQIEAAIDRGRIQASDRDVSEPISEVELELKSGGTAALYDVALDLLGVAPVRLATGSKLGRGYRLGISTAERAAAVHADALEISPAMSGSDALQRIGIACIGHIMRNEAAALAGDPEGIHQMRVGVRRLRAALAAFGKMLRGGQRRRVAGELRWLADALGTARNLDVFESGFVAPVRNALGEVAGLAALSAAAERRRKAAHLKAAKAIRSTRYTASLLRVLRWFESRCWTEDAASAQALALPIGEIAPSILDRRRRAAAQRAKGFAAQTAEERHRVRIVLKKLRYSAEMLGGLYDSADTARFTKPLRRLQDDLGEANDVRVGRDIIAELTRRKVARDAIGQAGRTVLAWHEHRLQKRDPSVGRHLDRLLAADPFWLS
jgi:triphosphatase